MVHQYQNWRHVSIISSIELQDKAGNPLNINNEPYAAFGGYVSSRPTRLVASTVPWKDNEEKECVIVGITSRWNEKIVELYENIYFQGSSTDLQSYGSGSFPVEGWSYKNVTVQKDSGIGPSEITSHINFQHEASGEEVSVRWDWLVDF